MGVKDKTIGEVRYFTYYLIFPGDNEMWTDQTPFVHELQYELKKTSFGKDPYKVRDLLNKGETHWKDHNGVTHRVVIENVRRPKIWGAKRSH